MVVYKITNKINGKFYIGQTTQNLVIRWKKHIHGKTKCTAISNAIQKYGKENFEIKVLAQCNSIEEMNHRESYYIKLFNTLAPNGYNLRSGGNNSLHSESTKIKLSKCHSGDKAFWFGKKGKNNPNFGLKRSEENKKRISNTLKGRKQTEEHRQKATNKRKKSIICNETGYIYPSIKDAAKSFDVIPRVIGKVLSGERKKFRQLTFSYYKEA